MSITDLPQYLITQDSIYVDWVRARVITSGCALLFAYALNFLFQIGVTAFYKPEDDKKKKLAKKRLLQITRVLYWFGVASIFSIYPPYYYGIHCAVIGWLTFAFLIGFHLSIFTEAPQQEKRSIWAILYFFYHLLIFIWILVTLIMAYIWSSRIEKA